MERDRRQLKDDVALYWQLLYINNEERADHRMVPGFFLSIWYLQGETAFWSSLPKGFQNLRDYPSTPPPHLLFSTGQGTPHKATLRYFSGASFAPRVLGMPIHIPQRCGSSKASWHKQVPSHRERRRSLMESKRYMKFGPSALHRGDSQAPEP